MRIDIVLMVFASNLSYQVLRHDQEGQYRLSPFGTS